MSQQIKRFYEFGPFRLDTQERLLLRNGDIVPLTPKAFDTLLTLIHNSGHLLEKDYLIKQVWPDSFVEEGNLAQNISLLRRILGENAEGNKFIETIPRRGYRFVAQVRELEDDEADLVIKEHTRSHIIIKQTQEAPELVSIAAATSADLVQYQSAEPVAILAPPLRRTIWQRKKMIVVGLVGLLILSVAAFGVLRWQRSKRQYGQSKPLQITRLTTTGNVLGAMLSPDGKYMASVRREPAGLSLWVRHMATGSDIQLRPPAMVRIYGHTFSPDSNYIYFTLNEAEGKPNILYRLPVLGGTTRKVLEDVNGPISFSPDGARFAFTRTIEGQFSLMLANSDGSQAQVLAQSHLFDAFRYPQWSPDGTMITYTAYDYDAAGKYWYLAAMPVTGGEERAITAPRHTWMDSAVWLQDRTGLLLDGIDEQTGAVQIYFVAYPSGEISRITNDAIDYSRLQVTNDGSTGVCSIMNSPAGIWVTDTNNAIQARPITSGAGSYNHVAWTIDGRIIYDVKISGKRQIAIMNADGSEQKQLTDEKGDNFNPTISADGKSIIFVSTRTGRHTLWQMELDGGNQQQLLNEESAAPQCTPDNQWIVSCVRRNNKWLVCRVPRNESNVELLNEAEANNPVISPDGKLIAYTYYDETMKKWRTAVSRFDGRQPLKIFDFASERNLLRWTADGNALAFIKGFTGGQEIWLQPLDGSPQKRFADFRSSDDVFDFAWSPDHKKLACVRGTDLFDAVLFTNFH